MQTHPLWKRFYVLVILLAVASGILLALTRPDAPAKTGEDAATVSTADPHAVVGVFEGRLAVFSPHGDTPAAVYDVFVSSLPAAEQEALYVGIPVYSETALQRLLEDYTG
ncbi:MAG: hypothetical protein E7549_02745 [Ruminococcaceae bacterium]|nr:hypothetical protein [Oscillospiraceae bacterium]